MKERLILIAMLAPQLIQADDLRDAPLSLRLPAALGHISTYGDVASKSGASAASKFSSALNPAGKSWSFPEQFDYRVSGQYSHLGFDNGSELHYLSESVAYDAGDLGVLRLSLAQITSNSQRTQGGTPVLPFEFDLNGGQLSWGKKISPTLALGAEAAYSHARSAFHLPAFDLSHTETSAWNGRAGVLWSPADKWFLGLHGGYWQGHAKTNYAIPTIFGTVRRSGREVIRQWNVQTGIAYEYSENALLLLDYEASRSTNGAADLIQQRVSFGADIKLLPILYLRTGVFCDARRNLSWSTGLGLYASRNIFIDLAFQNDAFPELHQEFGRSQTLNVSVSVQW